VMAGVPSIMQAMLDEVAPKLKTGTKLISVSIRAEFSADVAFLGVGAVAKAHPEAIIGSYPFFDEKLGPNTNIVVRSRDAATLDAAKAAVEAMLAKVKAQLAG
jgi:molybdopterin-biosynthesis enzyme MoeA-like protein